MSRAGQASSSFRPSAARAGIQLAFASTTPPPTENGLDSRPGLLPAGVTFFCENDDLAKAFGRYHDLDPSRARLRQIL